MDATAPRQALPGRRQSSIAKSNDEKLSGSPWRQSHDRGRGASTHRENALHSRFPACRKVGSRPTRLSTSWRILVLSSGIARTGMWSSRGTTHASSGAAIRAPIDERLLKMREAGARCHRMFWGNRDAQMHVIRHQMAERPGGTGLSPQYLLRAAAGSSVSTGTALMVMPPIPVRR